MTRLRAVAAAALLAATIYPSHAAQPAGGDPAADYPRKPIRIVIGFTPGGGPDIMNEPEVRARRGWRTAW